MAPPKKTLEQIADDAAAEERRRIEARINAAAVTIVVGYFVAALTTFAWVWDSKPLSGLGAIFAGAFWPFYWTGQAAVDGVHWARTRPPEETDVYLGGAWTTWPSDRRLCTYGGVTWRVAEGAGCSVKTEH